MSATRVYRLRLLPRGSTERAAERSPEPGEEMGYITMLIIISPHASPHKIQHYPQALPVTCSEPVKDLTIMAGTMSLRAFQTCPQRRGRLIVPMPPT